MNSPAAVRRLPARTILRFAFAATLLFALLAPYPAQAQSASPEDDSTPVLGILGLSAPDGAGVTVARVLPDSGADEAGIETGDLITGLDGTTIADMEDLTSALERVKVGDSISITYSRDGQSRTGEVELGSSSAGRGNPFQIPNFEPRFPEDGPGEPRDPGRERQVGQNRGSDADYRPVIWLFGTLITVALATLIVLLVRKNRKSTEAPVETSAHAAPATATAGNPLEVLRMRYAKGEITRDEYLTISSDLNGGVAPAGENPTQEL